MSEVGYLEYVVTSWLSLGGVFLFVCVAIGIVMALARPLRDQWWIPGAAVFVGLGLLFAFVSPYLIPDQAPLRNDRLARAADQLAREQGVSDIPVKVEDVDEFTDEPNAFAAGLGPTRRVILWNTLLDPPFSDREVRVVIAHELGAPLARPHLEVVRLVRADRRADGAAGRRRHAAARRNVRPPRRAAGPVRGDRAPDRREPGPERGQPPAGVRGRLGRARDGDGIPAAQRDVFRDLTETSLTDPDPPDWAVALFGTHPTAMQRIEMAEAWRARNRP